jgi:prepilin signal peptidase PulO-like enzyme (type II secretory pathway)
VAPLFLIGAFLLGAIIASFVGVVAARLNTGEPIARGRSRCDACGRTLGAYSLVPLLSYAASGGRAQCCGARLSWLSPLSEFILGGLYAFSYHLLGATAALFVLWVLLALLLALVLYDLAHMVLPPKLLAPFVILALLFAWLAAPTGESFLIVLSVALALGLFLALLNIVSGGKWMGLADGPLAFGLALLAGPAALMGFVYAFWIGAVIGIVLLLGRPRGSRMGVEVPFAPFLALGFLLAYFTQWDLFAHLAALL